MPERVLSSICYLFADDLKLLSISSSIKIQNDIVNGYKWSVENGLIFHPDRTKHICNTSSRRVRESEGGWLQTLMY